MANATIPVIQINEGNVGIGTTTPAKKLEIATPVSSISGSSTDEGAVLRLSSFINYENGYSGEAFIGGLEFYTGDSSGSGPQVFGAIKQRQLTYYNQQAMCFFTSLYDGTLAERMHVDSTGKVGIGSRFTPTDLFTVIPTGTASFGNKKYATYTGTDSGAGSGNGFIASLNDEQGTTLTGNHQYKFYITTTGTGTYNSSVYIVYRNSANTAWVERAVSVGGSASNHPLLDISGNNAIIYDGHSSTYTVRYRVETTNSNQALTSPNIFGVDSMWQNNAGSLFYNDGNVGIGTDSPGSSLEVMKDGGAIIRLHDPGDNSWKLKGDANFHIYDDSNSDYLTILNNGNIGINKTLPVQRLDIDAGTASGGLGLKSSSSSYTAAFIANTGTGNAGIYLDASNGDFIGSDYAFVGQNNSLDLELNTGTSGGGISFVPRGSNAMYISTGGLVGIGTINPQTNLEVATTTATAYGTIRLRGPGGGKIDFRNATYPVGQISSNATGDMTFFTGDGSTASTSSKVTILSAGNVGIGMTGPTATLQVDKISSEASIIKVTGSSAQIEIETESAGDATLYMRPNITGNKAAAFKMTAGTVYNWRWQDDAATPVVFMKLDQNPGTLTVKGDVVAYGSPSDERLKENIKPIESALDKVSKLQGVTFDWKESDSILDIKEDIGFIAQDVQKVVPELVRENEDGMLSMRHQGIAPILLEAIKELKAEIEDLKKKIK